MKTKNMLVLAQLNKMKKLKLKVNMDCSACAVNIDKALSKVDCESQSNPALKITKIQYDESKITPEEIIEVIKKTGYDAKL